MDSFYVKRKNEFIPRPDVCPNFQTKVTDRWNHYVNDLIIASAKEGRTPNFTAMFVSGTNYSSINTTACDPGQGDILPGARASLLSFVNLMAEIGRAIHSRADEMGALTRRAFRGALFLESLRVLDSPLDGGRGCEETHDVRSEVVVAQVSAILFAAVSLRVTVAYLLPKYRKDICLMGGGAESSYGRGMAVLVAIGACLGLIPIVLWVVVVHPAFEDVIRVQEQAEQNSFERAEISYGAIMFMAAYGVFTVLSLVTFSAMWHSENSTNLPRKALRHSAAFKFPKKSIYSEIF